MSQRLTGKAITPATASAKDSAPQKRVSPTPASIAPGDGERDGAPLREAERGADDHAQHLADRAPGQASAAWR